MKGGEMRGIRPKGKIKIRWSANFAYAMGLLATDGYLSSDARHIVLVSKDKDQLQNFAKCLGLKDIKIGDHRSGTNRAAFRLQFGDVIFYRFLENIGLENAKSKTIGKLEIPSGYFFDFLRGVFDGDGYFYSYWDLRWKSSYMFYTGFTSASSDFISWLRREIFNQLKIVGHVTKAKKLNYYYQLKYAKKDSLLILTKMYHSSKVVYLRRKRLKIDRALSIIGVTL